jgi:multidrug efflux pump subunit AcrA (membrane-fusion protein)
MHLPPQYSAGQSLGAGPAAGNPTDYLLLLVPILMNNQVSGLIEVWQDPGRHPSAVQGFLQFMVHMAELASRYMRNRLLGEMIGQQELWTKMEVFARQIHESLNPVEVAYRVANEGRRLIDCDRVSVGIRYGRRVVVEAVSGADVVEKRSNLVQRMRTLFDKVLAWGEKLVYTGTKDDTLPPEVLQALDAYLEESPSKLLCILPLRDERETGEEAKNRAKQPPRSMLMMECFEPAVAPDQLVARQEVLGRHASSALYNAVEHRRIPMRFLWMPLARLQEGLGGKTRAIIWGVAASLILLLALLYLVPYPLKVDSGGKLMPQEHINVFPATKCKLVQFVVESGQKVAEDENLILAWDRDLQIQIERLDADIRATERQLENLVAQLTNALTQNDRVQLSAEIDKQRSARDAKVLERNTWVSSTNSVAGRPGFFWLRAPKFPSEGMARPADARWTVLSHGFKEQMTDAEVRPSDPLLRLGFAEGPWEVMMKIPQKHIGQVTQALDRLDQAKRRKFAELLDRAVAAEWISKKSIAAWLTQDQLNEVRSRAGMAAAEDDDAGFDRTPVLELLRMIRMSELQDRVRSSGVLPRAVEAGWIPQAELEDLLRESELDVDLLVKSAPTDLYKGKLTRSRIASAADQDRDENNEAEPVVIARVRISGDDIDPADRIPAALLLADTQVSAKIRCGSFAMGYSLFYGVWEFLYEKVVFFF